MSAASDSKTRGSDGVNLRREARVETAIKVALLRGRQAFPFETSDVSFKGLFLRTDQPPPLRSLVRLRLTLPSGEIEAHAMAIHAGSEAQSGIGVQFWGLAGPHRVAWDDFIRELLQARRIEAKRIADGIEEAVPSGVRVVAPPFQRRQ